MLAYFFVYLVDMALLTVKATNNGVEALRLLRKDKEQIDLVVGG